MTGEPLVLKRNMKAFGTLLITLSAITPASSVFIISPSVAQQAGTGAFLSFVLAALIGVFMAFVYAELASAFPVAGGEYSIVARVLGPFAGFIVLGINLITMVSMIAAISMSVSTYLNPFFPNLSPRLIGIGTLIITVLFGILNIRVNAVITGIFLAIELIALFVLSYLGFSNITRSLSDFVFHPVYLTSAGNLESAPFALIGLGTAVAIWAYNGYGQAVYLGEETHDARTGIAKVILGALAVTVVAEAVPTTSVLLGAPDLKTLLASQNMMPEFIASRGGEALSVAMTIGLLLAILNATIAIVLMVARQFYSSGRDQVWPRFMNRALTQLHGRFHSPWVATFFLGILGIAACFVALDRLFLISATGLVIVYAALCWAALAGRRSGKTSGGHYRMPFYPLPPIAGLLALGYVIYANYLDEAVGRPSLFITLGMALLSAIYYLLVLKRRGGWKLDFAADAKTENKSL